MSKEKFMEAKPLARLATAILIEQILDLEPNNTDMIDLTSKEMMRVRNKLIAYKKAHLDGVAGKLNNKIKEVILQDAKDRGHWDRTIYADAVAYREKLKPYMFLSLLKDTDSWRTSDEEKLAIKNLTYVMLKHNKLTHKQLDQFELVPKVQPMADDKIYDLQIAVA